MQITTESYGRVYRVTVEELCIRSESAHIKDPTNYTLHFEKEIPRGHTSTQMITNHKDPRVILFEIDWPLTKICAMSLVTGKVCEQYFCLYTNGEPFAYTMTDTRLYVANRHKFEVYDHDLFELASVDIPRREKHTIEINDGGEVLVDGCTMHFDERERMPRRPAATTTASFVFAPFLTR